MSGTDREHSVNDDFKDKVALVTGGGSGIGRAACLAFAQRGASVAVVDRNQAAAHETCELIAKTAAAGGHAPRTLAVTVDVAQEDEVNRMVAECIGHFGRLDCAFNNAGIGGAEIESVGRKLGDIDKSAWDKMIGINLTGVWMCMKAELAAMQARGGAIVNTASIAGVIGLSRSGPYTASKHGVVGLTKVAALEYSNVGIRVNAICPGYVATPLTEASLAAKGDKILARLPIGRFAEASEIAELAVWLCSDSASYVTGSAYGIDGGYVAGI